MNPGRSLCLSYLKALDETGKLAQEVGEAPPAKQVCLGAVSLT